jgi:fructosamine-3-kinase
VIAERVAALLGRSVAGTTPVGGGCICPAHRVTLEGGDVVFAKSHPAPPPGFFAVEASGLRWLRAAGATAVPEVLAVADDAIVMAWIEPGAVTALAAEQLGRSLAALHAAGSPEFGAPQDGYIGSLPLPNGGAPDWATFYAAQRIAPYVRLAVDAGALTGSEGGVLDRLCDRLRDRLADLAGPAEPPARIHGDLWSGNVLWGADGQAWLVDPAAHGGHRETDLAMLALFGPPHPRVIAAYDEAAPLAPGWRDRVGLHQLHPLLVHTVLFGGHYGAQALAVAGRYVSSSPPPRRRK